MEIRFTLQLPRDALTVPVALLAMVSPLRFPDWQWLVLVLSTPVVFYSGIGFHRAALKNARHLAATMDTLISLGTLAAWGWSVVALFFLDAGVTGMKMPFHLMPSRSGSTDQIYLEVASVVVTFLLAGRSFEARAKRCATNSHNSPAALSRWTATRRRSRGSRSKVFLTAQRSTSWLTLFTHRGQPAGQRA